MTSLVSGVIKRALKDNNVVVFSKSYCPFCMRVKDIFDDHNIPYHAIELDERDDGLSIQEELKKITGQTTVPNVFIRQKHIGGCDDVQRAHAQGQLQQYLQGKL